MKNKIWNLFMNSLLVMAGIAFVICFFNLIFSFEYKNRETEDTAERHVSVFEYELKHKAYHEILDTYYAQRLNHFEPQKGFEDIYRVAEYSHAVFMSRIYEEEKNENKIKLNDTKREALKEKLGAYTYTAEEVEEAVWKE